MRQKEIGTQNFKRPAPISAGRARTMSSIRGTGNRSTELKLASILRKWGLKGWRRHQPFPGKPDFVWIQHHVAVFVDGCFWHGCPRCYQAPRHNAEFWRDKIATNRERDARTTQLLRSRGWRVVRIWECKIDRASTLGRIKKALIEP